MKKWQYVYSTYMENRCVFSSDMRIRDIKVFPKINFYYTTLLSLTADRE